LPRQQASIAQSRRTTFSLGARSKVSQDLRGHGSALEATRFSIGTISAPGYRYHPGVIAQAIATVGEMYPGRTWVALGSGEAINEAITGEYWPDKRERTERLTECVEVIRALLAGETVTHRGRITVVEAKVWSRPEKPPPLLGAAVTAETARWCGGWADGLLTTGRDGETLKPIINAFHEGGGEGKPIHAQVALSWAPTESEAYSEALDQWAACCIGGEVSWDLRRPSDFDRLAKSVTRETIDLCVHVSSDIERQLAWVSSLAALGIDEIHLHQVGRNQEAFVEAIGKAIS
jgi:coenzyme F420-dependent glucose-6-phosphate dehydrogenase